VHKIIVKLLYIRLLRNTAYLGSSVHLGEGEKRTCMSWCDDQEYKKDFEDAVEGLDLLPKYLHKHHKEKAIMLVDEYDSLPMRAMFRASEED
jgi:hypothetical protein